MSDCPDISEAMMCAGLPTNRVLKEKQLTLAMADDSGMCTVEYSGSENWSLVADVVRKQVFVAHFVHHLFGPVVRAWAPVAETRGEIAKLLKHLDTLTPAEGYYYNLNGYPQSIERLQQIVARYDFPSLDILVDKAHEDWRARMIARAPRGRTIRLCFELERRECDGSVIHPLRLIYHPLMRSQPQAVDADFVAGKYSRFVADADIAPFRITLPQGDCLYRFDFQEADAAMALAKNELAELGV